MVAPNSSAPVAHPPDTNYAPNYLIICGILSLLALALCIARLYTRLQPKHALELRSESRLSPDDYLIALATLIGIASYFVAVGASTHGWGHLSQYVDPADRVVAKKCLFAQQVLWILGVSLVRLSVAWSLLRFSLWKPWKYALWCMMGVQVVTYIGFMLMLLGNCRPVRSFWEPVTDMECWDRKYTVNYGWVANSILVAVDFALATMPIQLLRNVRRPLREKILVGVLMALGLFATGIAAYKMTLSTKVYKGDTLSTTVELSLWNRLEMLVGIIAACMPCLKSWAGKMLHQIGVLASRYDITMVSFERSYKQSTVDGSGGQSDLVDSVHTSPSSKRTVRTSSSGAQSSV